MKITKTMSLWNWTPKTKNKNPSLYAGVAWSSPIFLPKNRSFIIFVGFQAPTISSLVSSGIFGECRQNLGLFLRIMDISYYLIFICSSIQTPPFSNNRIHFVICQQFIGREAQYEKHHFKRIAKCNGKDLESGWRKPHPPLQFLGKTRSIHTVTSGKGDRRSHLSRKIWGSFGKGRRNSIASVAKPWERTMKTPSTPFTWSLFFLVASKDMRKPWKRQRKATNGSAVVSWERKTRRPSMPYAILEPSIHG